MALPSKDSILHGAAYLLSEGILECIDVSAQGGIRWRRFINTRDPNIHVVGKILLVVDHGHGRIYPNMRVQATGLVNRVVAYDGTDGRFLWEHGLPADVRQTISCGGTQIFHDGRRQMFLANGAAQVHTFQDRDNPHLTGLVINVSDMDALNKMLASKEGFEAARADGVRMDTIKVLVEAE